MAIWAEAWWGRNKEKPPIVAPNPISAAFLKKSRRLGFPLLSLWDDIFYTSLDIKAGWSRQTSQRLALRSKTGWNFCLFWTASSWHSMLISPFSTKKRSSAMIAKPWLSEHSSSLLVFP
jgi:hypothetical protein